MMGAVCRQGGRSVGVEERGIGIMCSKVHTKTNSATPSVAVTIGTLNCC